ncbi:SprT family zinc-dependent metalloprotease [Clostridium sp.]|uniref:M48 family metallopeptidase n=1 Tax=Clostridium sp. TaxID=1506 RepID=UPI0029139C4D|nr:SprT family zinc-dependent metalloprotease [Clostridium sp.]MDU5107937.1 SprT family zinc-dependent metalloprotease [Clostridium sp.]
MNRSILINGNVINYDLIFKNKKNLSMKLNSKGELVVYAPTDISIEYIEKILNSKEKWITTNINKIEKSKINNNYSKIHFLGNEFTSKIELSNDDNIYFQKDILIIKSRNLDDTYIENLLSNWYKIQANIIVKNRVDKLAAKCSLFPTKSIIRNQKTRWGSCNSKKEIRLNWRLILMPYYVMDYIIIHELCHLKYMNHSKDFWSLVEKYDTNYKLAEIWLKENGINIMRIN